MKKIVLTGATSMLGVALVNECIRQQTEVLAIVRPNSMNLDRLPESELITIIECDLDKLDTITVDTKKYDVFYHFAWDYTYREKRDNAECQELNIKYTLDAVRLSARLGCDRFIGAGSQAEYGRVSDVMEPDTPVNPDIAYGVGKYAAGKLSAILCRDLQLQHIWTRIFSVYGSYDNEGTMIMYAIKALLAGEKPSFTKSEQDWDYLYCKDAARAFYLIGEKGKAGATYCIGSGKTRKLYEYINVLRNEIDKLLPVGIGEREYASNQVMHLCADIESLKEDTGFEPAYSFERGIEETITWYKENFK